MSLCRLLVWDFTDGTGRYDEDGQERYDDRDLEFAAMYAQDLQAQGFTREPFLDVNLEQFKRWAQQQQRGRPQRAVGP